MKVIRGRRDQLRDEGLDAILSAIIHNRPEDWERAQDIDRRLAHRGKLALVVATASPPAESGCPPSSESA
ncbi:hypothetical protein [Thiorhodococcus minor]|uniref:Uncharacterized protein n=1 Tax=Thiorhodococcus minor TaxID=57489 RepID=A0A6M0K2Y5_9GAMM|nr:hypothetical protein [Thiorhodococcus minor]NEV63664.1 hypothetical protein [Thiorhodococcus minor]